MTIKSWLPSLLYLLVLVSGVIVAFLYIPINSQLPALLPSSGDVTHQVLVDQLQSGQTSRMILLGLTGATRAVLAEASKQLAQAMRESGHFVNAYNGEETAFKKDQALIYQYRYLLSPTLRPSQFQEKTLHETLSRRLTDIANLLPTSFKRTILEDPTQEFVKYVQNLKTGNIPKTNHGVWFSSDKDMALLVAETLAPGFDLDAQETIQTFISQWLEKFKATRPDASSLKLLRTGPSLFAIQSRALIQHDARWLTGLGITGLVSLLLITYRSVGLILLSIIPLATALLVSCVAVYVVFGFLHGITLAFGATLIGVAIDYPIHVFTHLHPSEPTITTMKRIWPTIRLGALTTAIGYGAMLMSGFPGLSQLGFFAIIGLLTAAGTTRWILPFFIPPQYLCPSPWIKWVPHKSSSSSKLIIVILILAIGYLSTSSKPFWESDIANLNPLPSDLKKLDLELRKEIGVPGVRDFLIIKAPTPEEVLQQSENLHPALKAMVHKGDLGNYEMAAHYLPSAQAQQRRQVWLPDSEHLEEELHRALTGLPFKSQLFQAFLQDVEKSKYLPPLTPEAVKRTAVGTKIRSLLYPLREQWLGLIVLQDVQNRSRLTSELKDISSGEVYYLDLKDETSRIVTAFREEILKYLGLGVGVLFGLLAVNIRSFSDTIRIIFPVAGALVLVLAVLHALDEKISLFHLASLLLVFGVGMDYVLFLNRHGNNPLERETTISAIWVCSLTTMLVFGVLAFSQTPILHSIGLTTCLGALFCLMMSLVYAPRLKNPSLPNSEIHAF